MAEPASPYLYPSDVPGGGEQLPRCCPRHPDWATLSQHLIDQFPHIAMGDIVREVSRAKEAVENVALPPEESLEIGELIARHQLLMWSGHVREAARLDPERHLRAAT